MSHYKIKNEEIFLEKEKNPNNENNKNILILNKNNNSIFSNEKNKSILMEILNETNNQLYKKIIKNYEPISNRTLYTRNNLLNINLNTNNLLSKVKKNSHIYHLKNELKSYENINNEKLLNMNNIKNFSYTNNSILSRKIVEPEINEEEEKKIKNINKNKSFIYKQILNKKNNIIYILNHANKQEININKDENNLEKNLNEAGIGRLSLKSLKIENIENKKRKDIETDRFNNIFNRYISNNIINGLNSFNKIKDLIKLNGFNLDKCNFNTIYKYNNNNNYNNQNLNLSKNSFNIKKLINKENIKNNSLSLNSNNSDEKNKNIVNRQKIYLSPVITKISKDKIESLLNKKNINDDMKFKSLYIYDKGYIKYIINEVNNYYKRKNFISIKDFYNKWLKENGRYITINDIYYFLNKIIKLKKPINKGDILKNFFNYQINSFDYQKFKEFFFIKYNENFSEAGLKLEIKNETNYFKRNKETNIEDIYYFKLIKKIILIKDALIEDINNKENNKNSTFNYNLNYEQFYNLIKNNLKIKEKYDYNIKRMYLEYYDKINNRINLLHFLEEIEKQNNIRNFNCEYNSENKDNINRKEDIKINSFNNRVNSKKNEKTMRNLSYNNLNDLNSKKNLKYEFKKKNHINKSNKDINLINKDNKIIFKSQSSFSRKKEKNSDIINYL